MLSNHSYVLDLVPPAGQAMSTWEGIARAFLSPSVACQITFAAVVLSLPWTRSLSRSIAGAVMVVSALLATMMAAELSPFLLVMCVPPALYGFAQGSFWATSKGKRLVWFIPVMDGRSRRDLLEGACWFWTGVCGVGLGFHLAFILNPQGQSLASLQYGAVQLACFAGWVSALMAGYTIAVYSMAALARGFFGIAKTFQPPRVAKLVS